MRATRAYITSLGTTGLLIASALLTLSVMSAFVAFNGFPGQDVQDPIGTLLVQERQAPVTVPAHPAKVGVLAAHRHAGSTASRDTRTKATRGPLAHTAPVKHRMSAPAPSGNQPSTSAPQQQTNLTPETGNVTPSLPSTGTPSLPSTGLPPLPTVTVPGVTPPSSTTQLPVDTSGLTGILGSP